MNIPTLAVKKFPHSIYEGKGEKYLKMLDCFCEHTTTALCFASITGAGFGICEVYGPLGKEEVTYGMKRMNTYKFDCGKYAAYICGPYMFNKQFLDSLNWTGKILEVDNPSQTYLDLEKDTKNYSKHVKLVESLPAPCLYNIPYDNNPVDHLKNLKEVGFPSTKESQYMCFLSREVASSCIVPVSKEEVMMMKKRFTARKLPEHCYMFGPYVVNSLGYMEITDSENSEDEADSINSNAANALLDLLTTIIRGSTSSITRSSKKTLTEWKSSKSDLDSYKKEVDAVNDVIFLTPTVPEKKNSPILGTMPSTSSTTTGIPYGIPITGTAMGPILEAFPPQ